MSEKNPARAWRDRPCNIPGYNLTMEQYADAVIQFANQGSFALVSQYLNQAETAGQMMALSLAIAERKEEEAHRSHRTTQTRS
jgi:hypothetical protein